MRILAIETSCDETSIALVECSGGLRPPGRASRTGAPKFNIVGNIVSSQIPVHRPFGGVVPNLAKREHIKNLPIVLRQVFGKAQMAKRKAPLTDDLRFALRDLHTIDLIAVTVGPGLEPALWAGIEFAKQLQDQRLTTNDKRQRRIPLVGANHLKGHLYSFLADASKKTANSKSQKTNSKLGFGAWDLIFPAVALLVSGGHTILLKLDSLTKWKKLGETRDDAAGEAFDKVARLLGLPYPGGPEIAKLALRQARGKRQKEVISFPRPMIHDKSYDFSFSGLKTAVLYYLRDNPKAKKAAVAASFQNAVVEVLTAKTMRAAREFGAKSIILCGGVAANKLLRKTLAINAKRFAIRFFVPPDDLNGDNAAMIAIAAYIDHLKRAEPLKLEAKGNLNV